MNAKQTPTKSSAKSEAFTAEERAAMKERVKEQKAAARRGGTTKADGESDVREKLAEMPDADRGMGERLHEIITATAPDLTPRTWYGMPAYEKDGKVVCFFQNAHKFKARYATLGFNDSANLDDGALWPTAFAVKELTAAAEARVAELVRKAVS